MSFTDLHRDAMWASSGAMRLDSLGLQPHLPLTPAGLEPTPLAATSSCCSNTRMAMTIIAYSPPPHFLRTWFIVLIKSWREVPL